MGVARGGGRHDARSRGEESIGIDDGPHGPEAGGAMPTRTPIAENAVWTAGGVANAVAELFPEIYRRLHSRFDTERVGQQAVALLDHLVMSGPLTVGEIARHLGRAQSVVSEIVDGLEQRKLVERMRDARDRRRTMVWLTEEGQAWRARAHEVLSRERLAEAVAAMPVGDRRALVDGMRALVAAADSTFATRPSEASQKKQTNQTNPKKGKKRP
jgi:DNA-binding MarR family transcriptional regulator